MDDLQKKLDLAFNPQNLINQQIQEDIRNMSLKPLPPTFNLKDYYDSQLASSFYEALMKMINDFDAELDQDYEVGVRLINFGQVVTFHLQDIGYDNPALIFFKGFTGKGEPVKLVQHVSQISILLMKMKRKNPNEPKIGFKKRDNIPDNTNK